MFQYSSKPNSSRTHTSLAIAACLLCNLESVAKLLHIHGKNWYHNKTAPFSKLIVDGLSLPCQLFIIIKGINVCRDDTDTRRVIIVCRLLAWCRNILQVIVASSSITSLCNSRDSKKARSVRTQYISSEGTPCYKNTG